jgi:cell division protein FtsB
MYKARTSFDRRKRPGMKPGRKLIIIAAALFITISFGRGLVEIGRLWYRNHTEAGHRDDVLREKEQLETEVERLKNDSLYIEEIARKEYGMIREGEEVYHYSLPDSAEVSK